MQMNWQHRYPDYPTVESPAFLPREQGWGIVLACLLLILAHLPAMAQQAPALPVAESPSLSQQKSQDNVQVTLETDRQTMGVADQLRLTLTVNAPHKTQVVFPELGETLGPFIIHQQTPSTPRAINPTTQQWQHAYILEASTTGDLTLPPLSIAYQRPSDNNVPLKQQTIETDPRVISVTSILPQDADVAAPQDIVPPVTLTRRSWPLWLWIALGTGLALALTVGLIWWYRRRQPVELPPPPQPAHVLALDALRRLQQQDLIGQHRVESFYVQVSAILRRYVEWRFNLRAPEQTTEEFLATTATSHGLLLTHRDLLGTFLEHCDLVKFARHEPTSVDMQQAFDSAKTFVEQTADDQVLITSDTAGAES